MANVLCISLVLLRDVAHFLLGLCLFYTAKRTTSNLRCYGLGSLNQSIYISVYDFQRESFGVQKFTKEGYGTGFIPLIGSGIQAICSFLRLSVEKNRCYCMFLVPSADSYFINKLSTEGHGIFSACTTLLKKPKSVSRMRFRRKSAHL